MLSLSQYVELTPEIQNLLIKIEGQQTALTYLPQDQAVLTHLRHQSILNSALYSARIEGNQLTHETFVTSPLDRQKIEVQNLLDTYTWLTKNQVGDINLAFIKDLHARSLKNLIADAGHFRTEQNAIFNQAGVAVYLPPPSSNVQPLLTKMLDLIQQSPHHPLITNIIAHYQFEKIHPFVDGNGRVGRLLFATLLKKADYRFADLLGLDKYLENTRSDYYFHLSNERKNLTDFVLYFLELINTATDQVIRKLTQISHDPISSLLPRRQELLHILWDHSPCSFDFLHRRFMAIPPSTLRYDLLQLQKAHLVTKLGSTRGVLYHSASPRE